MKEAHKQTNKQTNNKVTSSSRMYKSHDSKSFIMTNSHHFKNF